ncbi:MAG: SemiSWEET family transporter [Alphaproteobacteria bacterium]|nr:SemiSWEET family transporter [Alphaproteobacteria bacterium]
MKEEYIELVGFLGTLLTSITFVPQVYHSWKSKKVASLSIWMVIIVIASTLSWLAYGFLINSRPVILANSIVFLLALVLLYFKITFKE